MGTNEKIFEELKTMNKYLRNIDGFGRGNVFILTFLTATIFLYTLSTNLLTAIFTTPTYYEYVFYALVSLILSAFLAKFVVSRIAKGIN